MADQSSERPPQFTLAKLFWMVTLSTPVMLVGRAEWNYSFPLFSILAAYFVSLASNYFLFGCPYPTIRSALVGSVVLLSAGMVVFYAGFYVGWLVISVAAVPAALAGAPLSEFVRHRSAYIIAGILAVIAANLWLAHHRRWISRPACGSNVAPSENYDAAGDKPQQTVPS